MFGSRRCPLALLGFIALLLLPVLLLRSTVLSQLQGQSGKIGRASCRERVYVLV